MDYLIKNYPDTKIYNITNSELSEGGTNSIDEICRHYGVPNIRLHDIEKQTGHPSIKGMKSINEQIWEVVGKEAVSQNEAASSCLLSERVYIYSIYEESASLYENAESQNGKAIFLFSL